MVHVKSLTATDSFETASAKRLWKLADEIPPKPRAELNLLQVLWRQLNDIFQRLGNEFTTHTRNSRVRKRARCVIVVIL